MKSSKSNGVVSGEPQSGHKKPTHATNGDPEDSLAQTISTRHATTESTPIKFRLYVAGNCPNSLEAEFNLRTLCRELLPERHEIEIVDVLREPDRALKDQVSLTPLLLKLSPAPAQKITGRLNFFEPILEALGLLCRNSPRLIRTPDATKLQGRYRINHENGFDPATAA